MRIVKRFLAQAVRATSTGFPSSCRRFRKVFMARAWRLAIKAACMTLRDRPVMRSSPATVQGELRSAKEPQATRRDHCPKGGSRSRRTHSPSQISKRQGWALLPILPTDQTGMVTTSLMRPARAADSIPPFIQSGLAGSSKGQSIPALRVRSIPPVRGSTTVHRPSPAQTRNCLRRDAVRGRLPVSPPPQP